MHPNLVTLYNLQLADTHIRNSSRQIESLDWGESHQKAIKALRVRAAAMAAEKANTDKAQANAEKTLAEMDGRIKRSEKRLSGAEIHNLHEMESVEKEL
ncbi:MAG: hypothetical protein LC772_03920, partial [Chloroflexi bacterium]|nr:hypothetical protein [Chloroflexota bacterium]